MEDSALRVRLIWLKQLRHWVFQALFTNTLEVYFDGLLLYGFPLLRVLLCLHVIVPSFCVCDRSEKENSYRIHSFDLLSHKRPFVSL